MESIIGHITIIRNLKFGEVHFKNFKALLVLNFLILGFGIEESYAQCYININSARGYTASIELEPDSLIKPSTCPWGYNFTVRMKYSVSFSGTNIPSGLNTLNAYLHCGTLGSLYFAVPKTAGSGQITSSANIWNSANDCSSATLSSLGCDSFAVRIQGPGIPSQTIGCAFKIPVQFIDFTAKRIGKDVHLTWTTAFEQNHNYYIIQRSRGDHKWEDLDTIKGNGNSNKTKTYNYMDYNAEEEEFYYQVKQVDFDGRYSYTLIRKVSGENSDEMLGNFTIFPNPSEGILKIEGLVNDAPIQLFDMQGVEQHNYLERKVSRECRELDLGALEEGVYLLRILQKNVKVVLAEDLD